MAKLVAMLLGLGVVGYVLYTQVKSPDGQGRVSNAKQTLDNAQHAADQIEQDAQRRADELLQKSAAE